MSSDEKAIQECSKNTEIEQSDGRQTRSMTKDKQNNQKKDNLQKKVNMIVTSFVEIVLPFVYLSSPLLP